MLWLIFAYAAVIGLLLSVVGPYGTLGILAVALVFMILDDLLK